MKEKSKMECRCFHPCHLFLDSAFFFFVFSFRFSTGWLGDASLDFVACLVLLAWLCMPGCRRERVWIVRDQQNNVDVRSGRDRMESDVRCNEGHVRALLCISFLRHQKPKQQKTVEKGKISVFSLEWNCCCGGVGVKSKWRMDDWNGR